MLVLLNPTQLKLQSYAKLLISRCSIVVTTNAMTAAAACSLAVVVTSLVPRYDNFVRELGFAVVDNPFVEDFQELQVRLCD